MSGSPIAKVLPGAYENEKQECEVRVLPKANARVHTLDGKVLHFRAYNSKKGRFYLMSEKNVSLQKAVELAGGDACLKMLKDRESLKKRKVVVDGEMLKNAIKALEA